MAADSRGAVVFYHFWDTYSRALPEPYARPWDETRPMETPVGLADPAAAARHLEEAVRWVRTTYGREDIAWGVEWAPSICRPTGARDRTRAEIAAHTEREYRPN